MKKDACKIIVIIGTALMYIYVMVEIFNVASGWKYPLIFLWLSVVAASFILCIFIGRMAALIGIAFVASVFVILVLNQMEQGVLTTDRLFAMFTVVVGVGVCASKYIPKGGT